MRRALLVLALVVWSCSGSGEKVEADAAGSDGLPADGGERLPDIVAADLLVADATPEELPFALDGGEMMDQAVVPECEPGQGCFMDLCEDNSQCQSGWCVEHLGEGVCTKACQEECPSGWTCKQLLEGGPDVAFICISDFSNLCRPCSGQSDCVSPGGVEDACLFYPEEGSFCGGACEADEDCPAGFDCRIQETVDGVELFQCVALAGVCPCSGKSTALGLWTPCQVTNEFGTCIGKRVCTEEGLSECDAVGAEAEVCDGIDNDCDGLVDVAEGLCDDGNGCTEDSCAGEGGCTNVSLTGVECMDGDPCTVADHCEAGQCLGSPVVCDDENPCTADSCDVTGGCLFEPLVAPCDDGNPCTAGDLCGEGKCKGTPVDCACQNNADCGQFEVGNLCTGILVCDKEIFPYQCVVDPATVVECAPPEGVDAPCLLAKCLPETGECESIPTHEGAACGTGDACVIGEVCVNGACGGGVALNCADDNPCTDDSCDALAGCLHESNDAACFDGSLCTVSDQCVDGLCVPGQAASCDDKNPCTDDSCNPAVGCVHQANDEACSDGNACTTGDHCNGGVCQYAGILDCDDGNLCTTDGCSLVDGCVNAFNSAPCDDGSLCTTGDVCQQGQCISAGTLACDDGNPCTDDLCDDKSGCQFAPNAVACDDQDQCTTADICADGQCSGSPVSCDDGNPCTDDSCQPDSGCLYSINDVPCDDENACTANDVCAAGICEGGEVVDCDDGNGCTSDSCDGELGCLHAALSGTPCDDGNACTQSDNCVVGACVGTGAIDCGESGQCAEFSCDPDQGCIEVQADKACDDGEDLTTDDWCTDGLCSGLADLDEDGVADAGYGAPCNSGSSQQCVDNCLDLFNATQADADGDGIGDACDNCPLVVGDGGDSDDDGVGDGCDLCPGEDDGVDSDGDGQPDGCEVDWVGQAHPNHGTTILADDGLEVSVLVYKPGITDTAGQGENIDVMVVYTSTEDWLSVKSAMSYAGDDGLHDRYTFSLPADALVDGSQILVDFAVTDTTAGADSGFAYNNDAILDAAGKKSPLTYNILAGSCGDGIVQVGEECDDNNVVSGDGCSKACRDECVTCLYVAKTGSDDAAGLADDPLLTIQKAVSLATSGWTIHVDEGIYREKVSLKANITIRGVDRNRVIVHGGGDKAFEGGSATGFGTVIEDVWIQNNTWGYNSCTYFGQNISPTLRNVRLGPCGGDGLVGWRSSPRLFNSLVQGCDRGASFIYQHGSSTCGGGAGTPAQLRNNTFVGNQTGIAASAAHCSPIVENNIFYKNEWALYEGTDKSCGFFKIHNTYNLYFGNDADFKGAANQEAGELFVDPKMVGGSDYHLLPGSPAIDAGKPGTLDGDGSVADLGYVGGPDAITAPSLVAGFDFNAPLDDVVTVQALSEHANGVVPTYTWTQMPYNPKAVVLTPNGTKAALSTTFESTVSGKYAFAISVIYDGQESLADIVSVTVAPPKTVHVPADYPTIQQGIDAAVKADTVLVAEGTYVEKVVLKPGITLRGEGPAKTIVDGEWCEPAAVLMADNSVLENLQLTGNPDMGYLVLMKNVSATVQNCLFNYKQIYGQALSIQGAGEQLVQFNTFKPAKYGGHIYVNNATPKIRHNIVTGGYTGVYCSNSQPEFAYNDVWDNKDSNGAERNYEGCVAGETDISVDPQFTAIDDFTLLPDSPCIDAGDPTEPDADNTPPDLGAFPYQAD